MLLLNPKATDFYHFLQSKQAKQIIQNSGYE